MERRLRNYLTIIALMIGFVVCFAVAQPLFRVTHQNSDFKYGIIRPD